MSYKDILVHLDNSARSEVRMNLAVELAARHDAHLAALYSLDLPSPAMFLAGTSVFDMQMADDILAQARHTALEPTGVVRDRFYEVARRAGVSGEWRCAEVSAAEAVGTHGPYADLIIVGQTDSEQSVFGTPIPELAILETGRPVLVVPYIGDVKDCGNNVVIGWKRGREAARAVNDALPLLKHAKSVTVLAIDPVGGIGGEGVQPAADIALHLARHGIKASAVHTVADGVPEGDILLNYASDLGADLLVVGGYGHSRAREFMLGGATRILLKTMTVPVLFSH